MAAYLSLGVPAAEFGESENSLVRLALPKAVRRDGQVDGEVIYIDGYGNLFTNVDEHDLTGLPSAGLAITIGPIRVHGVASSYASVGAGEFVAVINSWGLLEISVYKIALSAYPGPRSVTKCELFWILRRAGKFDE